MGGPTQEEGAQLTLAYQEINQLRVHNIHWQVLLSPAETFGSLGDDGTRASRRSHLLRIAINSRAEALQARPEGSACDPLLSHPHWDWVACCLGVFLTAFSHSNIGNRQQSAIMLTESAVNLAMAPYKYLIGIYDPPPLNGKNIIVTGEQQGDVYCNEAGLIRAGFASCTRPLHLTDGAFTLAAGGTSGELTKQACREEHGWHRC